MAKFITKSIIVLLLFLLVVTYFSEQDRETNDQVSTDESMIVVRSADLYNLVEEEPVKEIQITEQESFTYQISQLIEQSGLLIYEGIISVITDLAKLA